MRIIIVILVCLLVLSSGERKRSVLIIGDSISIGYTPFVREALTEEADVIHNLGNARFTGNGLDSIQSWLGNTDWDVIHFNFGLHDLCYRSTPSNRDKKNGKLTTSLKKYKENLEQIVAILKKTNAKLIFATTTVVPPKEPGRFTKDVIKYNEVARKVMEGNSIQINDLYELSVKVHIKYGKGQGDVHYEKDGYKILSSAVIKAIRSNL